MMMRLLPYQSTATVLLLCSTLFTATAHERMHIVRRLYGEENAHVRQNVHDLEERQYRYQTGLAPDPDFRVPYNNHPYERTHGHRGLQQESDSGLFEPMRIHFETVALDSLRDSANTGGVNDKIDCTWKAIRRSLVWVVYRTARFVSLDRCFLLLFICSCCFLSFIRVRKCYSPLDGGFLGKDIVRGTRGGRSPH